eukprot:TRINITY_DN3892_c0_g1_i1.p1 TRINITY_DN3892_c0_g1~~TRINITY_DN3892_c0_g1_i1.p1  ORF type:complete len:491 (+),score=110.51 TRINITY_DN3892_c0_g1_i1:74-1546(+)
MVQKNYIDDESIWVEHPTKDGSILKFDVCRRACEPHGFFYGDRVLTPRGESTVIGVNGKLLWFHVDGDEGASYWDNIRCYGDMLNNGFKSLSYPKIKEQEEPVVMMMMADVVGLYKLKRVKYQDHLVNIILQNENGPCPLIALCNVLALKRYLTIEDESGKNQVSVETLRDLIHSLLISQAKQEEQEQVLKSISVLPAMQTGMDVNFNFTKHDQFELTDQTAVFKILQVPLVHGWLISDDHSETSRVVGTNTYNDLMNKLVAVDEFNTSSSLSASASSASTSTTPLPLPLPSSTSEPGATATTTTPLSSSPSSSSVSPVNNSAKTEEKPKITEQDIVDARIINEFLANNKSQLTECGLTQLQSSLGEDELCVFFRNNHFSTLIKHNGQLYNLVTDVGYERERNVVWDLLTSTDGGSVICSEDFKPLDKKIQEEVIATLELMDFSRQAIADVLPKIPADKWFKSEDAVTAAIAHLSHLSIHHHSSVPSYIQ